MARKKQKVTNQPAKSNTDYLPFIVFGVAVILRLVYLFQSRANDPQFYNPVIDALFHHQWAQRIAGGDFWGDGAFFRAPLYPYFLALIYKLFGVNIFAAKLIQLLLGSLTAALTYLTGRRIFGRIPALIGGLLFACYAPSIFYEGELLLDPLAMFLVMLSALVTLSIVEKRKPILFLPVGMLWGATAICRPTALLMIAAVVVVILIFDRKETLGKRAIKTIMLVAGAFVIILPVTIRNYVIEDDFVLIASQGGINFYIGNNKFADGITATIPELPSWDYRDVVGLAENDTGRDMKPSEISAYYMKRGLKFWVNSPLEGLRLALKKAVMFFSDEEIPNNRGFYFVQEFSPILKYFPVTFAIIGPLSLLGMALIFVNRDWLRRDVYFILGIIIAHWASHIPFFVNGRFRLPVVPLLAIFAGAAAYYLFLKLREKNWKNIAISVFVLLLSCIIVFINIKGRINDEIAEGWNLLGLTYLDRGELHKAENAFLKAIGRDPQMMMVNLNLASISFYKNDINSAEEYLHAELKNNPYEIRALNNLSMLKRMQGDLDAAIEYANRAVEAQPAHEEPYINLTVALRAKGNSDTARDIINNTLAQYPYFHNLKLVSADFHLQDGDTLGAVKLYREILSATDDIMIKYADVKSAADTPPGEHLRRAKNQAINRLEELGYPAEN